MLVKPLPPLLDEPVAIVVLHGHLHAKLLGVPDHHVIEHLHGLRVQHDAAQPVGYPWGTVQLMEQSLVVLVLRLDVLEEDHLEQTRLQEDVDETRTDLHDGDVE